MPRLTFEPLGIGVDVATNTKILSVAIKEKVGIRYGCASCRCGTCGVRIIGNATVSPMAADERALLEKMGLSIDGQIRLACRTKIVEGDLTVDLAFQNSYSPDQFEQDFDDSSS